MSLAQLSGQTRNTQMVNDQFVDFSSSQVAFVDDLLDKYNPQVDLLLKISITILFQIMNRKEKYAQL